MNKFFTSAHAEGGQVGRDQPLQFNAGDIVKDAVGQPWRVVEDRGTRIVVESLTGKRQPETDKVGFRLYEPYPGRA